MDSIRPWTENPRYWQFRGHPVLLAGGSKEDNLFQIPDLEEHLDLLHKVGGNYVRCTMSARDPGDEQPHAREGEGEKFNLDRWNDAYWERFERLLSLGEGREVIVQIEVWDRFDFTSMVRDGKVQFWAESSWNPVNNVNYTVDSSGLPAEYPEHPHHDRQPFFHTVGGLSDDARLAEVVRPYQEAFVDKLLSISLKYGNVLYCMNNETTTPPAWGRYWMEHIRRRAKEAGREVYTTDMFDAGWKIPEADEFLQAFDDPEAYTFLDISQNNNLRNLPPDMWRHLKFARERIAGSPRPLNNVKVYGADTHPHASHGYNREGTREGVLDFWINLIGGCASARFHRPASGIGLNEIAQANLRTVRLLEQHVRLWECKPDFDGSNPENRFEMRHPDGRRVVLVTHGAEEEGTWFNAYTAAQRKRAERDGIYVGVLGT